VLLAIHDNKLGCITHLKLCGSRVVGLKTLLYWGASKVSDAL